MLVAAMNPCPCGFYGDSKRQCRCSVRQIENYRQKISEPLLDRIDIHVEVPLVDFRELTSDTVTGESSTTIRERVAAAREIQVQRFKAVKLTTNSAMGARQVRDCCQLDAEGKCYLEHAMEQMNFSARQILNVAAAALAFLRIRRAPSFIFSKIPHPRPQHPCHSEIRQHHAVVRCIHHLGLAERAHRFRSDNFAVDALRRSARPMIRRYLSEACLHRSKPKRAYVSDVTTYAALM